MEAHFSVPAFPATVTATQEVAIQTRESASTVSTTQKGSIANVVKRDSMETRQLEVLRLVLYVLEIKIALFCVKYFI
jgi:hypothetical protein